MCYPSGDWTIADSFQRPQWLTDNDRCYWYYEYDKREPFYDEANNRTARSFVMNLKKRPSEIKNPALLNYKNKAIHCFASILVGFFSRCIIEDSRDPLLNHWNECMLMPSEPSKAKNDPEYDDRIKKVCDEVAAETGFTVVSPVALRSNVMAAHSGGSRNPLERESHFCYDHAAVEYMRTRKFRYIFFINDLITSGAHFKAMQNMTKKISPDASFAGLFLCKTVRTS